MATQKERRAQTRHQILSAAAELFMQKGFDNTSLAQIVEKANVVKGTFYQHFQTKLDLLVVLGRLDGADRVRNLIDQVKQGLSALDALQRYYLVMAEWFESQPKIAQDVIFTALKLHDPNSNCPEEVAHDFTKLILEEARRQGEVRKDIDVNTQALVVGGAITVTIIDWCRDPQASKLQDRIMLCFKACLHGIKISKKK